ncbi:hypothetical protein [Nocardia testacea]|uniref:hypothetical protein n=1 Tax=Nocardia testacea TaxID=248551 RepID=UPI0033F651F1
MSVAASGRRQDGISFDADSCWHDEHILTAQDQATVRTAAYGAISLLAATGAPHKAATQDSIALTSATGLVGHVLAAKSKDIDLKGTGTHPCCPAAATHIC